MSFNVLSIRTGAEVDDAALHPLLSDLSQPGLIALDSYDGPNVTNVVATAVRVLEVGETAKTVIRLREVKIDVYITDGRVALACEKYDKGGGWTGFGLGGVAVAVTANAVSKARAASRSRGKVLVGHIRYPWVKAVGATSKTGFTSNEAIRLEYSEKSGGVAVRKMLELTLPKNIDATLVAQEIARRAATYRLTYNTQMTPETRAKFASLQDPARLQPPTGKFAFYQMPTFFHVSAATAFPPSRQAHGPQPGGPQPGLPEVAEPPRPLQAPQAPVPATVPTTDGELGAVPPQAARPGGADRPVAAPPAAGSPVFCTQCGTRSVGGDSFCGQCGARLKTASLPGPASPAS